jgi:hypothetical protein
VSAAHEAIPAPPFVTVAINTIAATVPSLGRSSTTCLCSAIENDWPWTVE